MHSSGTAEACEFQWDRAKFKNIDLWNPAVKQDPSEAWKAWAVEPPFYVEVGGAPQAVVTGYEDAKIAFEDLAWFSIV